MTEHSGYRATAARGGAEEDIRRFRHEFVATPECLADVRRTVSQLLQNWNLDSVVEAACICVTEIVSNVHRHAASETCVLAVRATQGSVRIVVSDSSKSLPTVRVPGWDSETGRGMFLVSAVSDAWGAKPTTNGKDVWCELRAYSGAA